jgi:hypothetical protein
METFPVYDYPITGDEPLPEVESSEYLMNLFRTYDIGRITPAKPSVESAGFISDVGTVAAAPFKSLAGGISSAVEYVKGGISSAVEGVKGTVRNTFLYVIGGVALIGIIAIVLLGAGSRFMGKIEGGN